MARPPHAELCRSTPARHGLRAADRSGSHRPSRAFGFLEGRTMIGHEPDSDVGRVANPCDNHGGSHLGRRTFFQWLTYGLSALAALAAGAPLIGYFFGVRKREVHWVGLDEVDR